MKRLKRVYVEITNVCNLRCSFCSPMRREPRFLTREEFVSILEQAAPCTDYLYFHVKGEPLLHPLLGEFLDLSGRAGFQVNLTTNGTLLAEKLPQLLDRPALRQINLSLHSFEGEDPQRLQEYLDGVLEGVNTLRRETGAYLVLRLWNLLAGDAMPKNNRVILERLSREFAIDLFEEVSRREKIRSITLAPRVFLSQEEEFEWPSLQNPFVSETGFCYGLGSMAAVLVDGTVVPCCLDADGSIPLGNLFQQPLVEILESPRAQAIHRGFQSRKAVEELCRRCSYRTRFDRKAGDSPQTAPHRKKAE